MKTVMKLKSFFALFLMLSVAASFNSCQPEEEDLRDVVVGSYNCTAKLYLLSGGQLEYMGSDYDLNNQLFSATKSTTDGEMNFTLDGTTVFTAYEFKKASNGTLFNVIEGSFDLHTTGMIPFTGYEDNYTLDDVGYSGGYMNDTKKIRVTLRFNATLGGETFTFISWIEGPKS